MNHVRIRLGALLARDEDDAAAIPRQHPWKQRAGEADAAHHVQLEHVGPLPVRDVSKLPDLEKADVVHEYIYRAYFGRGVEDSLRALRRRHVRCDAVRLAVS